MAELETLVRLQAVDSQIDDAQRQIEAAKAALGPSAELTAARRTAEQSRAALAALEKRGRDLEWDASDRGTKVKQLETKLYSGTVTSPKELSGLQSEVQHLKEALASVEEKAFETIGRIDEARSTLEAHEAGLRAVEERWQAEQKATRQRGTALLASLAQLKDTRQGIAPGVSAPLLARYEDLRKRWRGLAVARVDRTTCLGCRTDVPTAQVQKARLGQIVYCSSCGRILYVA